MIYIFKNANKTLIAIAIIVLVAVIIPIILIPNTVITVINTLYNFITSDMAWFFLLIGVAYTIITILFLTNKMGRYKTGRQKCKTALQNIHMDYNEPLLRSCCRNTYIWYV